MSAGAYVNEKGLIIASENPIIEKREANNLETMRMLLELYPHAFISGITEDGDEYIFVGPFWFDESKTSFQTSEGETISLGYASKSLQAQIDPEGTKVSQDDTLEIPIEGWKAEMYMRFFKLVQDTISRLPEGYAPRQVLSALIDFSNSIPGRPRSGLIFSKHGLSVRTLSAFFDHERVDITIADRYKTYPQGMQAFPEEFIEVLADIFTFYEGFNLRDKVERGPSVSLARQRKILLRRR